ncbi:MAG: dienelactone hydrolase family protein [Proteobacteria bacterium]|nr:dienelactone hydrolase family protein [Pseudomonadota bacterium]
MARGRELAAALGFDRALAGVAAAADALRASLASAGDAVADRSTPASLLPSGEGGAQRRMRGDTAVGTQPSMPDVSLDSMGTHRTQSGIAVIGFCWGGSVAFLANTRLGLTAVSYYGARSLPFIHEPLRAPMLFHFGERDHWISTADIEATRTAQPTAQVHVWPANHGFNCDARHDYDATCAHDALKVTLAFLDRALMR